MNQEIPENLKINLDPRPYQVGNFKFPENAEEYKRSIKTTNEGFISQISDREVPIKFVESD